MRKPQWLMAWCERQLTPVARRRIMLEEISDYTFGIDSITYSSERRVQSSLMRMGLDHILITNDMHGSPVPERPFGILSMDGAVLQIWVNGPRGTHFLT